MTYPDVVSDAELRALRRQIILSRPPEERTRLDNALLELDARAQPTAPDLDEIAKGLAEEALGAELEPGEVRGDLGW